MQVKHTFRFISQYIFYIFMFFIIRQVSFVQHHNVLYCTCTRKTVHSNRDVKVSPTHAAPAVVYQPVRLNSKRARIMRILCDPSITDLTFHSAQYNQPFACCSPLSSREKETKDKRLGRRCLMTCSGPHTTDISHQHYICEVNF